jgi:hypothetical protein
MLRNGVPEALHVLGLTRAERVIALGWYFVDPKDALRPVVHAAMESPTVIRLTSARSDPQVIVGNPRADPHVAYEASPTNDRFGRRAWAKIRLREPGGVWLVTPHGSDKVTH